MKLRQTLIVKFTIVGIAISSSVTIAQIADSTFDLRRELAEANGLCIQVGIDAKTTPKLLDQRDLLVHCLDRRPEVVRALQRQVQWNEPDCSLIVELWTSRSLPHAENLANLILVNDPAAVDRSEVERVLRPGGVGLFRGDNGYSRLVKPTPSGTDDWKHQWHASGGGLTTEDRRVDVPQGIQWLSGPLFAMAGRKSSTQSLVSSGGVNFYVTQNVLENVGLPEMAQYLVARDAYNGLIMWQRRWTGPFATGNGETNPRMVASPSRLYVAGENRLLSLNPKTGKTISEVELQRPADKILLHNSLVLVQFTNGITAFDSTLGSVQWEFKDNDTTTGLVAFGDGVYLLVSGRSADGRFQHDLIRLDVMTGSTSWRVNTQPHVTAARVRINFAEDGFVALQSHGHFHQFSAEDGGHLWTKTTKARPGKDYVDERYVGHFYRHGLVWMLKQNSPREPLGQNVWLGLDPATGESIRELTTKGSWPRTETPAKMGCQLLIASDRFIMIPRQATFIDFESGEKLPFKFARGGCGLGLIPANGLVYSHPHACGCFSEAIRGFVGMHSTLFEGLRSQEATNQRLQRKFAPRLDQPAKSYDWPIYRGSSNRGGNSQAELTPRMKRAWSIPIATYSNTVSQRGWKLRIGNVLTAPTMVGDVAFVAATDAGRLHAIDVSAGKTKWTFFANGRIDSPPTLYRGLCLFGSHDGYIYCLETKSGRLAWKFRAAPVERRIVAFGSIESAWPVAGSVLVRDGIVYAAAGRAPDADGGIEVHALDARTGKSIWSSQIQGGNFRGLCDYLVDADDAIYLANWRIDPNTGEHREADTASQHLKGGKVGLLEASWTKHDLALRKAIQTWTAAGSSGQLLAFSPTVRASYQAESNQVLIACDENKRLAVKSPEQVTGLALTSDFVVLAGGIDRSVSLEGGFLRLVDIETGEVEVSIDLPAEPVFDGVALAGRRILVSTQDGCLHCFHASD